jgi:hypothetical protein
MIPAKKSPSCHRWMSERVIVHANHGAAHGPARAERQAGVVNQQLNNKKEYKNQFLFFFDLLIY